MVVFSYTGNIIKSKQKLEVIILLYNVISKIEKRLSGDKYDMGKDHKFEYK